MTRIDPSRCVLVCHEKHDTRYWDATTPEAWAASSLAILTDRWNEGCWYADPSDDGLGDSDWAEGVRRDQKRALEMSREEYAALPQEAQAVVARLRRDAKRDTAETRFHREWYTRAKAVVEAQDAGFETIGRRERQIPKAWQLLDERSDHEYERVKLVALDVAPGPA